MARGRSTRRSTFLRPFGLLSAVVLLAGGGVLATLVYAHASRQETARMSMLFVEALSDRHELLQRELSRMSEELHQMASLFETQAEVGREQFRAFAREVVSIFPQIYACEWMPRVEESDRDRPGRPAGQDVSGYRVTSPGPSALTAADPRPAYFPVLYAEPVERLPPGLGLNPTSAPERAAAVARASETGRLTVSAPVDLPEPGAKAVFAILRVVRRPATSPSARPPASGFVTLVIRTQDVIEMLRLRPPSADARMRFRIAAVGADARQTRLASSPDWEDSATRPAEWQRAVEFGGQRWLLSAQPTAVFMAARRTRQPLLMAASAFLLWFSAAGLVLIAARRTYLAARREQDRVVGTAMRSLSEGVVVADAGGRLVMFNAAAERILGLGPLEIAPADWSDRYGCFYPDGVTSFPAASLPLARALRGETVQDVEVLIRNEKVPQGAWISINGTPLPAVDGAPGGAVVTFRDITTRRKTEAALRSSDEQRARQEEMVHRLHNAVEQTADSVFITNRQGVIEYVNRAFETTTGYSREEALGRTPRLLKSGRYDLEHYRKLWDTILAGQVYRSTNVNRRRNGEEYHAEQTITPMRDQRGEITHFVSVVKDVTERIRQQKREVEMEYAARVQQQLYPKRAPTTDEFDIAGAMVPASETGGDYFDYVVMPDTCLAVAVGDVCGHGLASALIMAETRAYVRSLAATSCDPAEILTRTNAFLLEHLADERQYVTLLLARLDAASRRVVYASAGHTDGFVLSAAGDVRVLRSTGVPLGMFPGVGYARGDDVPFDRDEVVMLLTDGITETEAPDGRVFSARNAIDVVRAHRHEPARAIVAHLRSAVQAFAEGQSLRDDLTIVICKALQ